MILLFLLLTTIDCSKKPVGNNGGSNPPPPVANTFTNPLLSSGPDPWVIQKDTNYYYTHTVGDRLVLYRTSKMSELGKAAPATVWVPSPGTAYAHNVWAPELHYLDGKWYLYFAADDGNNPNHRMYVLENASADPMVGTWTFRGKITDPTDKWAIDGTVFTHNGQRYFIWSGWEGNINVRQDLYIARMSSPTAIAGERVRIATPTHDWERIGDPDINEAPAILRNSAGTVFLTYSASGCWTDDYSIGMMTLRNGGDPMNPSDWTKRATPVFTKKGENNAYGPGHNTFFKSRSGTEDWMLYHANSLAGQGCSNSRNPRMQQISWNTDGTPNFGEPVRTNFPITKPSGE